MKSISIEYLKCLLKNTSGNNNKKMLNKWIMKGGEMVKISDKEYIMLGLIKKGGIKPEVFHKRN